ncbi:MAG TPA: hypothetical protein VLA43_03215 [Longimicrobiales bacterium]|nr:hypothetical protein [Longimicrobiales bacterium]
MKTRRSPAPGWIAPVAVALAGVAVTAPPARGAGPWQPLAADSAVAWRVVSSPFADLWYHGLAVVGLNGFGVNPLHDVAYGRRAARDRPAGPLVTEAPRLRALLEADPAFEILHFLPVYLADAVPGQALDGLRAVAEARGPVSRHPAASVYPGLELVAGALASTSQREILGRLVEILDAEWQSGLAQDLQAAEMAREDDLRAMESRWSRRYAPALADYLSAQGLQGGWIIPTPALGMEGRFFQGDPGKAADNVVIVGWPSGEKDLDGALSSVVREFCFPAVRAAFQELQSRYADRVAASRASDAAATRCGELLLEHRLPGALPAYRARFGLQGSPASAWSSLPDPAEGRAWDHALMRALNLRGGS